MKNPLLSPLETQRLISQQVISDQQPWVTEDDQLIEEHLKAVCATVLRLTGANSRVEWNHYGSGYASFIEAWFYKTTPDFNVKKPLRYGEEHTGLVVLLSRLSPYFVFMESEKNWHKYGGSSYLPEFDMIDNIETPGVTALALQIQPVLESFGLIRAVKEQLAELLPANTRIPTILSDRAYTQFDALFYWED